MDTDETVTDETMLMTSPELDQHINSERELDSNFECSEENRGIQNPDSLFTDEYDLSNGGPNKTDLIDEESKKFNDVPLVGTLFESEENMYAFYNQYARRIGFSIRRGPIKRSKNGKIRKRVILCSKEGLKGRHSKGTPQKARPEMRTGCMARIQCIDEGGQFVVTKFIEEHNHKLVESTEAHLLRSQRNILPQQVAYMDSLHSGGCGPSQVFTIMSGELGGPQYLNFTQTDLKNKFQKKRRDIYKEGDAQVALNYFKLMKKENPCFFSEVQVDENGQACNLFWADAKARIDYGVNHHGNSILLGMALLLDEKTESFVWAFESFLSAMSGKHPKTIFTDQAQAIGNAIQQVMPNTHHRLCLWHIYQNAAKHLTHVFTANTDFAKDFQNCLYSAETEEEFESLWNSMIMKYCLYDNDWVTNLFSLREKWAPVYGREHFCAGMTTTQRSESVNSFVKGYLNASLRINDFIKPLKYTRPFATRSYWMVFPGMGYIFASAFNCIFSSYSNMGSTTWLPLRTPPPDDFKVVTILNLDNEHFVKAILKPGAPLPPVVSGWGSICNVEALLWTPHMEMLHRGWENIEQNQHGQVDRVTGLIDLNEP